MTDGVDDSTLESPAPVTSDTMSQIKAVEEENTVKTGGANDPLIGSTLDNRYRILSFIGGGGMSVVYKAKDEVLNKVVAIKLLHAHLAANPVYAKRFLVEARAAFGMSHPNVISIYNFGTTDNGSTYIVMDYLDGTTLSDCIRQNHRLTIDRAVRIFEQICEALGAAHESGILHRDLKPSNIMLLSVAQRDFVKIVDFGIAKLQTQEGAESLHLTKTGEVFGSPLYMSPEQCKGEELDNRSDIYSLGCLMYECVSGKSPFEGRNIMETFHKHLHDVPPDFRTLSKDLKIPQKLEAIIFRSLSKDPQQRYQTMDELKADLEDFQHQQTLNPLARLLLHLKLARMKARRVTAGERRWIAIAAGALLISAIAVFQLVKLASDLDLQETGVDPHWSVAAPVVPTASPSFLLQTTVVSKQLEALRTTEGTNSPMYIEQLERAAKLNYINGRIEQAADEYKELYEHYAKEDGESANVTMQNLTWLGDCLLARSKFAEAATAYETVLDKTAERTAFKNSMPDLKIKLGDIYFHLQNYTKARYYYMDAYRDKSKDHPDLESKLLAELSARTADCERILAMYREAISHYQQAINDWEEVKEPVLGNIVMCNYYIGFCYMKLGNYADALKKYQEVFRDGGEKNIQMKSQASYVIAVRQYRDLLWKEGDYIQWFQQALRAADLQKELAAK